MALTCHNCQMEITGRPVWVEGRVYCCMGCAEGGPCQCERQETPSTTTTARS